MHVQLIGAISAKLGTPPTHGAFAFASPEGFALVREYGTSDHHPEQFRLAPSDLIYKVVDLAGTRLYLVYYPMAKTAGVIEAWQIPGVGISIRLGESLLPYVENALVEVPCNADGTDPPPTAYLPEGPAHAALRRRISDLMHRAAREPEKVQCQPDDVYLFPTGMAAVHGMHKVLSAHRPGGSVVLLGIVFHNTVHYLEKYLSEDKLKHIAEAGPAGLDELERWLEKETAAGRRISYLFIEFPSNPILVSTDLKRVKAMVRFPFPLNL